MIKAKNIIGGIGDVIISLEAAIAAGECNLYTHSGSARDLLEQYGVKVINETLFCTPSGVPREAYDNQMPRNPFPAIPIISNFSLCKEKPIVAIQPFCSPLAEKFWADRGYSRKKYFTVDFINHIAKSISDRYDVIVIGSQQELTAIEKEKIEKEYTSFHCVTTPKLIDLIALIDQCEVVIGTDSSAKAIAGVLGIESHVFIGPYPDDTRDQVFLRPYVEMGTMHVYKVSGEPYLEMFNILIDKLCHRQLSH